ncbi:MAG: pyridoxamine 5'-phosphate oxidase family protein, partial [Deltaproteobacteria bacterium]|nr:pyridoxamine 5'-phosphate oxidase family protein [Deltaproteobacteria bacterium]
MNTTSTTDLPSEEELKERAADLIRSQSTMTLATALENKAWAAPVYYVDIDFLFYFFSSPSSRHILEALESKTASAAVFHPSDKWKDIQGIQMSGSIKPVGPGWEAAKALRAYLRKFPFTGDFFGKKKILDLQDFSKTFRVKLYRFRPTRLLYMDNRIQFGFRA